MTIIPNFTAIGGVTISDKPVLVLGAGITGLSVARTLTLLGAKVSIFDESENKSSEFPIIAESEITITPWAAAVISPGWRPTHPLIMKLRELGIVLLNEIDIAWEIKQQIAPEQKWLAITGTNGKTSTVELAESILKMAGIKALACGNVGTPVIDAVTSDEKYDYLVLELSSFQLHWADSAEFVASAILNIAPDHIDWHGSMQEYAQAKLDLLSRSVTAILNGDDETVVGGSAHWQGRKIFYTLQTPKPGELGVVEDLLVDRAFVPDPLEAAMFCELAEVQPMAPHTVANSLAAAGIARAAGVSHEVIREAIKGFKPGRHRIELVLAKDGISWIDDSKATNPHAAKASIASQLSVVWIAGGLAKGAEMADLISQIGSRLRGVVLIGTDRELIATALEAEFPTVKIIRIDPKSGHDRLAADNDFMDRIVGAAATLAQSGDTVLLAPACASMDQFISYGDRGDRFAKSVREMIGNNVIAE